MSRVGPTYFDSFSNVTLINVVVEVLRQFHVKMQINFRRAARQFLRDHNRVCCLSEEEFSVEGILEPIDDVEVLPTEEWPSDHIALMANMQLKKKRKMVVEKAKDLRQPVADIWNKRDENSPCSSKDTNETSTSKEAADQECETSSRKESVYEEYETSTSKDAADQECETSSRKETVYEEYETSTSKDAADQECETSSSKEDNASMEED